MSSQAAVLGLLVVVAVQRLAELRVARRNEAWARARGAVEFGAGHYPFMVAMHVAWLLAWPLESLVRGDDGLAPLWPLWLGVFALTQALRYWAIHSLGARWNTRVLVIPGLAPLVGGPYRFLPHPNYVAVVVELAAVPLLVRSYLTAAVFSAVNLWLLLRVRIPVEERALAWAARASDPAA